MGFGSQSKKMKWTIGIMSGLVLGTAALVFVKTRSEVLQIREVFTKNKIAEEKQIKVGR